MLRGFEHANQEDFGTPFAIATLPSNSSRNSGAGRRRNLRTHRSSGAAGLRPASLSGPRLHLDSGLLGLRAGWLLLGSRHMGYRANARLPMDSGLLGLGRRVL